MARSNHQRKGIYLSDFNVSAPTHNSQTDVNAVDMYRLQNLPCEGEGCIHAPPLPAHMKSRQHVAERSYESYAAQTSDKAVLEEFQEPEDAKAAITEVVSRAVSPASEIGGDARLILPGERRIKSEEAEHDGLVRTWMAFCW